MRRYLLGLMLCSPFALAGCEDGPDQPFQSAPANAANQWNNSNNKGYSDPSKQGFTNDGGSTGTNKQEICTGEQKAKRWKEIMPLPLTPMKGGADIDMTGGDTWVGITLEQAEQKNCQSDEYGDDGGYGYNGWGDNGEVIFSYRLTTRKMDWMNFGLGYTGSLQAKSRDGNDNYTFKIGELGTKNGEKLQIHWPVSGDDSLFQTEVESITDAFLATYLPAISFADDGGHYLNGRVIYGSWGDEACFWIPLLSVGFWTANQNAPIDTASIIYRVDMNLTKVLPFSMAYPYLKLDSEGPIAKAGVLNKTSNTECTLKFGMNFSQFLSDCVKVTGDSTVDNAENNKLFGGFSHGRERFHFDATGVDMDFEDSNLPAEKIIGDSDRPDDNDKSTSFWFDQYLSGKILNDRKNGLPLAGRDNHGSGLIYLEYARLVQAELNKTIPAANQHQLGDSACLDAAGAPAVGCTGMEGFVTFAPPPCNLCDPADTTLACVTIGQYPYGNEDPTKTYVTCSPGDHIDPANPDLDKLALGYNVNFLGATYGHYYIYQSLAGGMKPGHHGAAFCTDATGLDGSLYSDGYENCIEGDIWATSFQQVKAVLGGGDVEALPEYARDHRFFFYNYVKAIVKYLAVAGTADENPTGVHNATFNPDDLHFDSMGAGQWEMAEYIDRRFASKTRPPYDISIIADVKNGIFNNYDFTQQLYRGDVMLYTGTLEDKDNHGPGQENTGDLTNLFGSSLIQSTYWDCTSGMFAQSAYQCATKVQAGNCEGQLPPLDANGDMIVDEVGEPLLAHYKSAFVGNETVFHLGSSHLKVVQTVPDYASAFIQSPVWKNPYKESEGDFSDPIKLLLPYEPKQPGLGFAIPVNGQTNRFVSTYHSDLSGQTITAEVMWDYALDADTGKPKTDGSIEIKAAYSGDFLGTVFLCNDPNDGTWLYARMYQTVEGMIDWINNHPDASETCGIVVRWSPFGNYPDFVSSTTNGVTVGITQGGGKGRVVDATLWAPGQ